MNGRLNYGFLFKEMPTTYKRKKGERDRWKQEDLERAINAVKGKAVVINVASRAFGIPSRTLRRQILQDSYKKSLGPAACLGSDAEIKNGVAYSTDASSRFRTEQKIYSNSCL
jgi:transposase-like protein